MYITYVYILYIYMYKTMVRYAAFLKESLI